MKLVIVTGMSGAGKTTVLKFLEDIGYYCVDNLPPALIPKFAEICCNENSEITKIALGVDIRGGRLFSDLIPAIDLIWHNYECSIIFLDCSNEELLKRYKTTRRTHPLVKNERFLDGIIMERELLAEIKKKATYIIDTTYMLARDLKEKVNEIFQEDKNFDSLMITILSFGFKYGIPIDADLIFDVRFIPNPFYIEELKDLTGNNKKVSDYVMSFKESNEFLIKLIDMLEFLVPNYIKEGKNQLVVGIGCTGGKHRSVTIANKLFSFLKYKDLSVILKHRDSEILNG